MTTADPGADPYVCEHCDDSVPHKHVDEKPLVERYRRQLLVAAVLGLAAAPVAVVLFVSLVGFATVIAVAAWALCTVVGVVTAAVVGRRAGMRTGVLTGALVSAGLTPLTAFGVVALGAASTAGPDPWPSAVAGTSGWLAGAGAALAIRGLGLRTLLVAHTREGEAARSAVVRTDGTPTPVVELGWAALTALWFGVCAAMLALLPILVVVLVPLSVALAAVTRRAQLQAQRRAAS